MTQSSTGRPSPIETLAGMGIREVLVILGGRSIGDIVELLADGRDHGLDLTYRYQRGALGIAHAIEQFEEALQVRGFHALDRDIATDHRRRGGEGSRFDAVGHHGVARAGEAAHALHLDHVG